MTSNATKRGRKTKPFITAKGEHVDGLYRHPNGRYKILATGATFREPDERLAVAKFRAWQSRQQATGRVALSVDAVDLKPAQYADALSAGAKYGNQFEQITLNSSQAEIDATRLTLDLNVPESILWPWLRQQLLNRADWVADKVGIPQLARLLDWELPKESIRLQTLIDAYDLHKKVEAGTKTRTKAVWLEFVTFTGAKTLRDLTTEKFLAYADSVKVRLASADSVHTYFAKVRAVISFGLMRGLDAAEIRQALDRAKVLSVKRGNATDPQPITPADFAKLLEHATDFEAAALLLSLNCCMYVSEFLAINWDDLALDAEPVTFCGRRGKTNIMRAAVLWPRTVEALRKLDRTPGAVFKSSRGCRMSASAFTRLFSDLRTRAGLPETLKHNNLRDGAYSAACSKDVPFTFAQILAGHNAPGQSDNYIQRNPKMVAPACKAVESHYFPQ